jgi:hypothetical protein
VPATRSWATCAEEDIPYDSMLERFREVRDEIELKIKSWLEHPEEELSKLREERERERRERMGASHSEIGVSEGGDGRPDPFTRA